MVDVIKARDFVWLLNEVFTNPHIMKVLHGADMDIVWLQKDFGVYMVVLTCGFHVGEYVRYRSGCPCARVRVVWIGISYKAIL